MTMLISLGKEAQMDKRALLRCMTIILCFVEPIFAGQLLWSLPLTSGHKRADGVTAIPEGTVFQLGVFAGSYVPTAGNQSTWAENWRGADFTHYQILDQDYQGFGGDFNVTASQAPFSVGKQMYVWGTHVLADGSSEQWLGTATTWQVPSADPLAFPVFIDIDEATTVLLGSSNSSADTIQLSSVSASFPLPRLHGEMWRKNFFSVIELDSNSIGAWDADPDADGASNAQEFFHGTDPTTAAPRAQLTIAHDSGQVMLRYSAWPFAHATPQVESSSDLSTGWSYLAAPSYDFAQSNWFYNESKSQSRKFYRFTWSIPALP